MDENGVVTAVRGGETTVEVCSAENEKRSASVKIRVNVHVTGATCDQKGMRLEIGTHAFGNVKVQPLDATNKNMTWTSSDESIASVTNNSNRPRIEGHKWGRVQLTGITEDGGYEASFFVNVGALHEALVLKKAKLSGRTLTAELSNASDMHMTSVTLMVCGTDGRGQAVEEEIVLPLDNAPGPDPCVISAELSQTLSDASAAVVAWETDTGYYSNADELKFSYRISGGLQEWKDLP